MAKGGATNACDLEGRIATGAQFNVFAQEVNRISTDDETTSAIRSLAANRIISEWP